MTNNIDLVMVGHPTYGWAHGATESLLNLPQNQRDFVFPESAPAGSNYARAGRRFMGTHPYDFGIPTSDDIRLVTESTQDQASTPEWLANAVSGPAAPIKKTPVKASTGPIVFPTLNLANLYSSRMLSLPKLDQLRTISESNKALYKLPNTACRLPDGIDLTTVELLVFFPGIIKDPYFVARGLAVGWDSVTFRKAVRGHRNLELDSQTTRHNVDRGMAFCLEMTTEFKESTYKEQVAVAARTKFTDYTSRGLSVPYQQHYNDTGPFPRVKDLTLSQLRENVHTIPEGGDMGTLSQLVAAQKESARRGLEGWEDEHVPDLRMSEVDAWLAGPMNFERIPYNADDDGDRCEYWHYQ